MLEKRKHKHWVSGVEMLFMKTELLQIFRILSMVCIFVSVVDCGIMTYPEW